jgi:DNA gyrase inhibitor GyrI
MNEDELDPALEQHIYASWLGKSVEADDSQPLASQYRERLQRIKEKNDAKRTPGNPARVTVRKLRKRRSFR